MTHIMQKHLAESNELPFIPLQLLVTTHITKAEEGEMSEDEIDDQTVQNIQETMGRSRRRGMSMALYRGKDHPKRGNIRDFSITCSR